MVQYLSEKQTETRGGELLNRRAFLDSSTVLTPERGCRLSFVPRVEHGCEGVRTIFAY